MNLVPQNKKRDVFYTPVDLCEKIVGHFKPTGKILEQCKGTGNFLKVLPDNTHWCEIAEGRDFFKYEGKVDWIITNPPFSQFRKFLNKAMEVSENTVFLTTINHLFTKARVRDVRDKNFGLKEILLCDTPKTFPQSGFQVGCVYLKKNYTGDIKFSVLKAESSVSSQTREERGKRGIYDCKNRY
jgi:hypothetical protein